VNRRFWIIAILVLIIAPPVAILSMFGCGAPLRTVWPTQGIGKSYVTGQEIIVTTGSPFLGIYTEDLVHAYKPRYSWQPPSGKSSGAYNLPEINPSQTWDIAGKDKDGFMRISCKNWRPSSDTTTLATIMVTFYPEIAYPLLIIFYWEKAQSQRHFGSTLDLCVL